MRRILAPIFRDLIERMEVPPPEPENPPPLEVPEGTILLPYVPPKPKRRSRRVRRTCPSAQPAPHDTS